MMRKTVCYLLMACLPLLVTFPAGAEETAGVCGVCGEQITEASNTFVVTFKNDSTQVYGCPGCGLTVIQGNENVEKITTMDFLRRTQIDAKTAYYLKGVEIGFCCEPYWLSFASKEEAVKFSKGFGGEVLSYEEAVAAGKYHHHDHH